jgi:hypothetical protein
MNPTNSPPLDLRGLYGRVMPDGPYLRIVRTGSRGQYLCAAVLDKARP